MAYDEDLANRIRELLTGHADVTEMAVAATGLVEVVLVGRPEDRAFALLFNVGPGSPVSILAGSSM
jgi:hypothetical protein